MIKPKTKTILRFLSVILIIFSIVAKPFMMPYMFSSPEKVYAKTDAPGTPNPNEANPGESNQNEKNFVEFLETINKTMYIALWPLLAVAGASMNNDLVYGKVFHLDTALWGFWQMMRNFCNYAIGFIFIVTILLFFFKLKEDPSKIKAFLPKLLIGGVLVQASWFLMGALIDLSTIMTYAFGALPLKVIAGSDLGKSPILMPKVVIDIGDGQQLSGKVLNVTTYDAGGGKNYPVCEVKDGKFKRLKTSESGEGTYTEYCVYSHPAFNAILVKEGSTKAEVDKDTEAKKKSDNILSNSGALTLQDLIKKGKGMVGVMYTLYTSLLNMANLNISSSNQSTNSAGFEFMIKAFVAFALIVPLFAFAIVLVIRIVVMWLFIGFSPIIVLANVFDMKALKGSGSMSDKTNISSVLGMIFLPVVAVFAMSISLIFLTALINGPQKQTQKSADSAGVAGALGFKIEESGENKSCVSVNGIGNRICITSPKTNVSASAFFNMISWLIVNMFGIALMRTIVFTALKSSKITAGVVGKIESFATGMAKAAPIFPIAGGVSVGALGDAANYVGQMPGRWQTSNFQQTLQPKLDKLFNPNSGSGSDGGSGGGTGNNNKTAGAIQEASGSGGMDKNKDKILEAFRGSHSGKDGIKNIGDALKDSDFRKDMVAGNTNIPQALDKAYDGNEKKGHEEFKEGVKSASGVRNFTTDGHSNYYVKNEQAIYSFKSDKLEKVIPYKTEWLNQGEVQNFNDFLSNINPEGKTALNLTEGQQYTIKGDNKKLKLEKGSDGKLQIK